MRPRLARGGEPVRLARRLSGNGRAPLRPPRPVCQLIFESSHRPLFLQLNTGQLY